MFFYLFIIFLLFQTSGILLTVGNTFRSAMSLILRVAFLGFLTSLRGMLTWKLLLVLLVLYSGIFMIFMQVMVTGNQIFKGLHKIQWIIFSIGIFIIPLFIWISLERLGSISLIFMSHYVISFIFLSLIMVWVFSIIFVSFILYYKIGGRSS